MHTAPHNATGILDTLDTEALEARAEALEAERRAVLILLRTARARERGRQKPKPTKGADRRREARHAD